MVLKVNTLNASCQRVDFYCLTFIAYFKWGKTQRHSTKNWKKARVSILHLARTLRQEMVIKETQIGEKGFKVYLFANGVIL